MWTAQHNRQGSERLFVALMAALVLLAWLALWLSDRSQHHGFLHAFHSLEPFGTGTDFALLFVAGWTVMIIAMMLPTSLPLVVMFRTLVRERRDRGRLVALLVGGYLGVWTLFGVAVYLGGWALNRAVHESAWLGANTWVLGAGVLVLAGVYQFTPLKHKCLEKCRSPLSFITGHWRGSRERSQALRLGAHHGLFCVGCCWSLMLLMFLVGAAGALLWMLVLGAVMAVEKNVSWGRTIGAPLGVLLVAAGLSLGAVSAPKSPEETAGVPLSPVGGSGVSGTATFTDVDSGVEVTLDVQNLPEPGGTYLAHIHPGTCAGEPEGGIDDHAHHHGSTGDHSHVHHHNGVGEIEHPLTPLVPEPGGNASGATTIEGVTVADLFSEEDFHVNVHAEAPGSEGPPAMVCADLQDDEGASEHDHKEEHHDH